MTRPDSFLTKHPGARDLLGKTTDGVIAAACGVTKRAVAYARKRAGIAAYKVPAVVVADLSGPSEGDVVGVASNPAGGWDVTVRTRAGNVVTRTMDPEVAGAARDWLVPDLGGEDA